MTTTMPMTVRHVGRTYVTRPDGNPFAMHAAHEAHNARARASLTRSAVRGAALWLALAGVAEVVIAQNQMNTTMNSWTARLVLAGASSVTGAVLAWWLARASNSWVRERSKDWNVRVIDLADMDAVAGAECTPDGHNVLWDMATARAMANQLAVTLASSNPSTAEEIERHEMTLTAQRCAANRADDLRRVLLYAGDELARMTDRAAARDLLNRL